MHNWNPLMGRGYVRPKQKVRKDLRLMPQSSGSPMPAERSPETTNCGKPEFPA